MESIKREVEFTVANDNDFLVSSNRLKVSKRKSPLEIRPQHKLPLNYSKYICLLNATQHGGARYSLWRWRMWSCLKPGMHLSYILHETMDTIYPIIREYQLPESIRLEGVPFHHTALHDNLLSLPPSVWLSVAPGWSRAWSAIKTGKRSNRKLCMNLALKLLWIWLVHTALHMSMVCVAISINLVYYFQYHSLSFPPVPVYMYVCRKFMGIPTATNMLNLWMCDILLKSNLIELYCHNLLPKAC